MPVDPYQWRESVMSTRSLSYISNADVYGTQDHSASYSRQPSRRNTSTSDDSDLMMADTQDLPAVRERDLDDIPELPDTVADCLLFTLPREIRDRVYSFCLTAQNGLQVEWPPLPGTKALYDLQPQLLRLCKIIRDEAAPLLYSLNKMTFHHPSDANMFARAMASPLLIRRFTTSISLHVRATDTRLWMPYLTSNDAHRSLKADFPSLREVNVRFRSNKWNHSAPPEQNINVCLTEDNKLNEVVDGLRHVFLPKPPPPEPPSRSDPDAEGVKPLNEMNAAEFMRFVDARRPGEDMAFKRQLLELHKAHAPAGRARGPETPNIRVLCVCRVNPAHFNAITIPSYQPSAGVNMPHANGHANVTNNTPGGPAAILAQALGAAGNNADLPALVREGEPFRGFTPIDFQGTRQKLRDPDLGSAKTATSPFASKEGILLALQLHTLDSSSRAGHDRHAGH
ncbi:hypothetical protein B0A50_06674 [Salinomyces thailandicus]|uniref:Uncharacterized protein n=1 Tax=Salinomyces thailandicus TaxID=706561 RepID=A0A4U0TR50_9PEZI|nr:hypothetical protein B0A50_06674 [Salinomyces thailandica]